MRIEQRGGLFYGDGIHFSARFPSRTPCGKADVPATNDWELVGCERCLEKRPKETLRRPPPAPPPVRRPHQTLAQPTPAPARRPQTKTR